MKTATGHTPSKASEPVEFSAAERLARARADDVELVQAIRDLETRARGLHDASEEIKAQTNAEYAELRTRHLWLGDRIRDLELAEENERHGWTTLKDGSLAKILPNGQVLSSQCGVAEFTDSDGQVYRETPEDRRRRGEQHKATVLAFKAKAIYRRLERAPTRRGAAPVAKPTRAGRITVAGRARATVRSAAPTRGDPDDPDPEPPGARTCACGCERELRHHRAHAKYFDASCRKRGQRARDQENPERVVERRLERLTVADLARKCRCSTEAVDKDPEGAWICVACGRARTVTLAGVNGYDVHLVEVRSWMRNDRAAVHRPRAPREWRTRPSRKLSAKLGKTRGRWDTPREEVAE